MFAMVLSIGSSFTPKHFLSRKSLPAQIIVNIVVIKKITTKLDNNQHESLVACVLDSIKSCAVYHKSFQRRAAGVKTELGAVKKISLKKSYWCEDRVRCS
jgi:hypothetical protein